MMTFVYMALGALLCAGSLFSCAWRSADGVDSRSAENAAEPPPANCSIVVLPFEGDADNPQLASRVRQSFYSHFSLKKFHDMELRDIDVMLDTLDLFANRQWQALSPQELGRCFNTQYLIYGKVLRTRRMFFVFYSQLALQVEIRLVETRRGTTVWSTSVEKRLQSGDMPLHPLSLVSAAVRTGIDTGDERMQDLIERTCRELAGRFPEPMDNEKGRLSAEIQVGSFGSPDRARQMAERLRSRGYEVRIEHIRLEGADWHRVIIGPYSQSAARETKRQLSGEATATPVLLYAR